MSSFPFHMAYTVTRELYGLELNPDEFETLGVIAGDRIGNKNYRLYKYQVTPTTDQLGNGYVDLPCNADIIEAVTADYEDYQKTSNQMLSGHTQSGGIEGYIETRKYNTGTLYPTGKFIKYRREGNTLFLSDKFNQVNILYKGFVADDEGLPFINQKEAEAIAAFCAYSNDFKTARLTKDQATLQMSQLTKQMGEKLCTQARIPEYLNQNEMDEILNVATSGDRKRFGKSFKPIR